VTTNTRPEVKIVLPEENATYAGGEVIQLVGEAIDQEDGPLQNSAFSWWVDFHHNTHTHPAMEPVSGNDIFFTFTQKGEVSDNVWYRVYLRATDSKGMPSTTYLDIEPRKHEILIQSRPNGLEILVENEVVVTPYRLISIEGVIRTFRASPVQKFDGKSLNFSRWSFTDPTHQIKIVTPNIDTTIVANYAKYGIYPNPVSDYLIIEYNSIEPVEVGISISTNSGALMMEWKETFS
jgi:hypothetical protein